MNSKKTTAAGIVALLMIILGVLDKVLNFEGGFVAALGSIDWATVIAGIAAGVTGLLARDNDRSSESAGAK